MYQVLAAISVLLFLFAVPPYFIDTLKGKTRPERATWFIYGALNTTAFVANISLGAQWSLVFLGVDTLGSLMVFALSLKFGVGGWTRLDRIALTIAAIGIVSSLVVHQPIVALLGVVLADVSGTALTIVKTFRAPDSETTVSWLLTGTGALCGLLTVGRWDFALILYPAYLVLGNYGVPLTQLIGRSYWRSHQQPKTTI